MKMQESTTSDTSSPVAKRHADAKTPIIAEARIARDRPGLETRRQLQQATEAPANHNIDNQGQRT